MRRELELLGCYFTSQKNRAPRRISEGFVYQIARTAILSPEIKEGYTTTTTSHLKAYFFFLAFFLAFFFAAISTSF